MNEFLNTHKGDRYEGLGISEHAPEISRAHVARKMAQASVQDKFIPEFMRAQSQGRVKSYQGGRQQYQRLMKRNLMTNENRISGSKMESAVYTAPTTANSPGKRGGKGSVYS